MRTSAVLLGSGGRLYALVALEVPYKWGARYPELSSRPPIAQSPSFEDYGLKMPKSSCIIVHEAMLHAPPCSGTVRNP